MPVGGVGGNPAHDPYGEYGGRAARRRAYEAQEKAAGRPIPGVTDESPSLEAYAQAAASAGVVIGILGGPSIISTGPTGSYNTQGVVAPVQAGEARRAGDSGGPGAPPPAVDPAAQRAAANDLRGAQERRADESVRGELGENFRIFERGRGVHGRGDGGDAGRAGRADGGGGAGGVVDPANYRYLPSGAIEHESTVRRGQEGARPQDRGVPERARGAEGAGGGGDAGGAGGGAGGAGRMVPAGGVPQLGGPVSGYNVQPISRSQARAAVARAQQMAAGSPQTTGEDLERINREANARAREHHEAQQLAARQSGRISHGPMIPSYGTHPSPHGHGHEYVG